MKSFVIVVHGGLILWGAIGQNLPVQAQTQQKSAALTTDWFAADQVLQDLVNQAFAHSPDLLAKQLLYESAQQRARAARTLPDPQLSGGIVNAGIGHLTLGTEPMSGSSVALQQNYPNAQKLEVKQLLADQRARVLVFEWQWQQQKLRREIQEHYFKAIKQRQSQRLLSEMARWYTLLQKISETRYQVGKVPLQEIWKIKLRRSDLERQALVLSQAEALHWIELRQSLGWPANFQVPSVESYPVLSQGLSPAPTLPEGLEPMELRWQRLQSERATLEVQMGKAEQSSDYFVMGGVTQRGTFEAMWELKAGMTLPIYGQSKNEPLIGAARQELKVSEAKEQVALQRIKSQWQSAYTQWQYAQRQQALYTRQILPEAKASVDTALAAYQGGQANASQVIESIAGFLSDQQQILELEAQRYLALSEMHYLMSGEHR